MNAIDISIYLSVIRKYSSILLTNIIWSQLSYNLLLYPNRKKIKKGREIAYLCIYGVKPRIVC